MTSLVNAAQVQAWSDALPAVDQVYRWSWFQPAFTTYAQAVWASLDRTGTVDDTRLTRAFFDWVHIVEQNAAYRQQQPLDYAHYVCGRLLRCLFLAAPAQATARKEPTDKAGIDPPALARWQAWPEGYLMLGFVCNLLQTMRLQQGFDRLDLNDTRVDSHWHSFRENVAEDADLAVPFLDFFLGLEPVWQFPTMTHLRPAACLSAR